MNSVMDAGMRLDLIHAEPWLATMRAFAKAEAKSPLYAPHPKFVKTFRVSKQRLYPRTTAEFEAGTELTKLLPGR